jgi:hypothetical protein
MVPFILTNDGTISMVLDGKPTQVAQDHPSYALIRKALKKATPQEILNLFDVKKATENYITSTGNKRVTIDNGQVCLDGKPVHNAISQRVLDFMAEGLPFDHLLKFMENIAENPSYNSQQELYTFLSNRNLPITEDGCFLAYKAVRQDWMDKYTGTVDNHIGQKPFMPRNEVDDDKHTECSKGLHVGALDYAGTYGTSGDRMLIVKVHPKDAVSVPSNSSFVKLRVCQYEVMGEFEHSLTKPLYQANSVQPCECCNNDNEYDEDGYDSDGYDENGYDCDGFDEDGFNEDGFDRNGYDEDGYDDNGLDEYGVGYDDEDDDLTDDIDKDDDTCNCPLCRIQVVDKSSNTTSNYRYNVRGKDGKFVCKK